MTPESQEPATPVRVPHVLRRYGKWAGSPKGFPEDKTKCTEEVTASGAWPHRHQCHRNRGNGPDGLYCKQHAKKHTLKEATGNEDV